jgi:hypothetical protein
MRIAFFFLLWNSHRNVAGVFNNVTEFFQPRFESGYAYC